MTNEAKTMLERLEATASEMIAANEEYEAAIVRTERDREFIRVAMRQSRAHADHYSGCNPGVILRLCEELRKP